MAQQPPAPLPSFDTASAATGAYKDEVESPSLSSSNALARFEFESGHGSEGTKILMVEWEDDSTTKDSRGDWHISWEGKSTVLPADDQTDHVHRLYFLLPPLQPVPPTVTLIHRPADATKSPVSWKTNPLPAIFPPELGASARAAGKKGVLHTIWAKRRLQALQKEIERESRDNVEGIGFVMAMQEKEWIEQNFGVATKPTISIPSSGDVPLSPTSPRSPGGSRLMERLKGLKLSTGEKELGSRKDSNEAEDTVPPAANPLSPEMSDVAVSSFSVFKGAPADPSTLAAKPAQAPRRIAAQVPPPAFIAQQQHHQMGGMGSLNAFAAPTPPQGVTQEPLDDDVEDDLFALPMSPRSPEMGASPFSFAASDTMKYVKGEKAS
ncbi:hypothetical protein K490DRAFT_33662 [Saccharata proteae CBS 121410]|uniref:Uncharacterized protein n=1 Tax=Saccharata proteae CBS 121410 TaxID=1314787 RepID=A0A9P4HZK9_9PEZI|nr:hypothetical protein K490DRAFT_33662 [Saccharata proteae CBS 121410]